MRRGTALWVGAALAVAALVVPASADGTDPTLPQFPCSHGITDAQGDAVPDYGAGSSTSLAVGNKPALDIRAVNLRLTTDQLQVFVPIDGVISSSAMAAYEASYRYVVTFLFNGKTFTYGIEQKNSSNPAQPLDGTSYPMENMGTGGDDLPNSTAVIRPGSASSPSWVIFTSPRKDIEKNIGRAIVPGDTFTSIHALTQIWTSQRGAKTDETTVPDAQAKYVVGQDDCFGPPSTSIGSLTIAPAQWSDSSTISAVLLDASGKPLAGKRLSVTVAAGKSTTLSATTNASGRATVSYGPIRVRAGSYPVTVKFAGDASAKASSATGTLKVSAEVTSFKALQVSTSSASSRIVTATLLDDDHHPVAGVPVDWWVNGKRTARGTTDKTGKVQLRSGKPGQTVQARYAGSPGTLLGAVSKTVKL